MEEIKTYEIAVSPGDVAAAGPAGETPAALGEPLRVIAAGVARQAERGAVSVYLCCADPDRPVRNALAVALARSLSSPLPATLLVDCDFLSVGLGGLVPQHDSLGFLDLLLYGSSLGVIEQTGPNGLHVIGAGSFPVTRKSPFVMDAFDGASRYLANHAECVVYCGPALDDAGDVHPIARHVDVVVLVRPGRRSRAGLLDALEDTISSVIQSRLWSVRLVGSAAPAAVPAEAGPANPRAEDEASPPPAPKAPASGAGAAPGPKTPDPKAADPAPAAGNRGEPGVRDHVAVTPAARTRAPAVGIERAGSSMFPKIVTGALVFLLIGFLGWWLYLTRSVREPGEEPLPVAGETTTPAPVPVDTVAENAAAPDTAAGAQNRSAGPANTAGAASAAPPEPADTGRRSGRPPAEAVDQDLANDIIVTEHVSDFAGKYLVHISSFRSIDHARRDAYVLSDRGYPVVIARVDLGSKGLWFRVYVGPYGTREAARSAKITLDDIPRVKFTRITKVKR